MPCLMNMVIGVLFSFGTQYTLLSEFLHNNYIASIWPQLDWYLEGGDFYVGVQTKRGCPHNCCYCVYTVVEGKQVRLNPVDEVVKEMRQLYDRGVRGFWFTDAQFIPARRYLSLIHI